MITLNNKKELKETVYRFWSKKLGSEYRREEYFLQLKKDKYNHRRPIAGWQKGKIITLNLNTIEKLGVNPEVVLAHEYGHLLGMPVDDKLMNEHGESHVGKELKDYA